MTTVETEQSRLEAPAVAYFDGFGRFATLGLSRIEALLSALDRPERSVLAYHVAGTNGKGSVSCFIASMLWAQGVRTGLYLSPHLQSPSERILLDGQRIAAEDLVRAADAVRAAAAGLHEPPTAFEAWTAAAFWHMKRAGATAAVVEVGLGGRGDATAVLRTPLVSVVSTVHRDHVRQLGPTIAHIAREKAGIFRPGRPVLLGRLGASALRVCLDHAREVGCPVYRLGEEVRVRAAGPDGLGRFAIDLELAVGGEVHRLEGLSLGLAGRHQADNAALAVAAVFLGAAAGGPSVTEAAMRSGLAGAVWPGRLERVGHHLIDGAHNLQGARALGAHLDVLGGSTLWVLGGLGDRPPGDLLDPLLSRSRAALAVAVASPRARSAEAWAAAVRRRGREALAATDLAQALSLADAMRMPRERVLIAGSLYLAGEARTALGLAPPWPRALPL